MICIQVEDGVLKEALERLFEKRGITLGQMDEGGVLLVDQVSQVPPSSPLPVILMAEEGESLVSFKGPHRVLQKPVAFGKIFEAYEALSTLDYTFFVGGMHFFPKERQGLFEKTGERILLTEKEMAIIEALNGAEDPLSRETLLARIWQYGEGIDTHTLETHIYKLRKKLRDLCGYDLLHTAHEGYLLKG